MKPFLFNRAALIEYCGAVRQPNSLKGRVRYPKFSLFAGLAALQQIAFAARTG
jgi:hypothetical protein